MQKILLALCGITVIMFIGHYGSGAIIAPSLTTGATRVVLSVLTGGSIGFTFITLSYLLYMLLWGSSTLPKRAAEYVGTRAAWGATLGTVLAVRALTAQVLKPTVPNSYVWDYLDMIGRLATFGTLLGLSLAGPGAAKIVLEMFNMPNARFRQIRFFLIPLPVVLGLSWAYRIFAALIQGHGWQ